MLPAISESNVNRYFWNFTVIQTFLPRRNVTVRLQGPAVTLKIINENGREYSVDLTLAIKNNSWPEVAEEWRRRDRKGIVKFVTEKN